MNSVIFTYSHADAKRLKIVTKNHNLTFKRHIVLANERCVIDDWFYLVITPFLLLIVYFV